MKKTLLIIIAIISLSSATYAQDLHWDASGGHKQQRFGSSMRGFYWGPVAGINVSTISQMSYSKARVRPIFGAMVGFQISNIIGVQAEALYSWEGAKMTNSDAKFSLNYLKVPIVAKVNIIAGLGIEAGLSFEPLIFSARQSNDGRTTVLLKDVVNKMDFTIPVGVTFLFLRKAELCARYYIPTTKIFKDKGLKSQNSVFSFTVKYRF